MPGRLIRPMQAERALLYAAAREHVCRLFLGSSAVEHSTVNRMVAGSNPARGASRLFLAIRAHPMKWRLQTVLRRKLNEKGLP